MRDLQLMFAFNHVGWVISPVNDCVVDARYPSLRFDGADLPRIAFYDGDGQLEGTSLKLAGIGLTPIQAADLDNSGLVNLVDYALLAGWWGDVSQDPLPGADFDGSGVVDVLDLAIFCRHWLWDRDTSSGCGY